VGCSSNVFCLQEKSSSSKCDESANAAEKNNRRGIEAKIRLSKDRSQDRFSVFQRDAKSGETVS
jgi:hypothetical protein